MINKSVKLISIDAMNTLIRLNETPGVEYCRFAQQFGINADPTVIMNNFKKAFEEVDAELPCYASNKGGAIIWWSEVVRRCFSHATNNKKLLLELSLNLYDYYSTPEPWRLVDENILSFLKAVKNKDYFIAITSNFDSRLRNLLTDFGINSYVDFYALSGELGVAKPNAAVFEVLLKSLNLKAPNELIHIGDDYRKDYLAAKNFGSFAYLVTQNDSKYNIDKNDIIKSVCNISI